MRKSILTLILSALLSLILLGDVIACSIDSSSSSPSPTTTIIQSSTPKTSVSPITTYAKEIMVFAAAGTKPAIDEAAKLFQQKYGTQVSVNYGGGGEVLSNMVIAKTGDVYIAPEQRFMNSAIKQGAVNADTAVSSLAYMIPVIGVKEGNPQNIFSMADLAKPGVKIVMGNPETMALGEIGPQMLQKAGLYDAIKQNVVTNAPQVTSIVTMLKMSQIDAGFIWHYFGITSSNDVDIIWIPKEYVTGIGEIQAAVSTYSQEAITAQKFAEFLVSADAKAIFKKNGYVVDREEATQYWLSNE